MRIAQHSINADQYEFFKDAYRGCYLGVGYGDMLGFIIAGSTPAVSGDYIDQWLVHGKTPEPYRRAQYHFGQVGPTTQFTVDFTDSMVRCNGIDLDDFGQAIHERINERAFVGLGRTAAEVIRDYRHTPWRRARSQVLCDHLSAIRSVPVAAAFNGDFSAIVDASILHSEVTSTTHITKLSAIITSLSISMALNAARGQLEPMQFITSLRAITYEINDQIFELFGTIQNLLEADAATAQAEIAQLDPNYADKVGIPDYAVCAPLYALYCFLAHPTDFRSAISLAIRGGGEADVSGALTGALIGAYGGVEAVKSPLKIHDRNQKMKVNLVNRADALLDLHYRVS